MMFLRVSIRRNVVYRRSKHVMPNGDHQPRTSARRERQCDLRAAILDLLEEPATLGIERSEVPPCGSFHPLYDLVQALEQLLGGRRAVQA